MLLRSRIIVPISRPPIENGGLFISGDRIVAVGAWEDLRAQFSGDALDLGDAILMPGLVNAHCHLDYTHMAGQITRPKSFTDWIKAILALKAGWSFSEYAHSWLSGAGMLLESGTTLVADIEAVPELLPEVWRETPLRVLSFLEMTGVKTDRVPADIINDALTKIDALQAYGRTIGLSPHALYSTKPELLTLTAQAARTRHLPVTTHVAESREELEMCRHRRGLLFDWLKAQRDMADCQGHSPVQMLAKMDALSPGFLAVHVNHLAEGDAELLSRNGATVVHCPRSHAYFGHAKFPYATLVNAGVNVCLGTDSLASMEHSKRQPARLSMFSEMQLFARAETGVPPGTVLRMATCNGGKALGVEGGAGLLAPGALADVIAIPFAGRVDACEEAAVHYGGSVSASMINGQWAMVPS